MIFPNPQAGPPAGGYVITASCIPGCTASIDITVTYDDGTAEIFSRTSTGGANTSPITIELSAAAGLNITSASTSTFYMQIRDAKDVTRIGWATTAVSPKIIFRTPIATGTTFATSYYSEIDSANERDTLDKFRTKNGFVAQTATGCVTTATAVQCHVVFHDTRDLGYGRRMFARQDAGGDATLNTTDDTFAFYVENYQVGTSREQSYDIANLGAAIAQNAIYNVGTK